MVRWMFGLSASICLLAILALHRRAIDYAHADGAREALRNSSVDDTRYLAIEGDYPTMPLPANQSFPPEEPLEVGKDVRLIPRAPDGLYDKQRAYLMRYNGMMMEVVADQAATGTQRTQSSATVWAFVSVDITAGSTAFLHSLVFDLFAGSIPFRRAMVAAQLLERGLLGVYAT